MGDVTIPPGADLLTGALVGYALFLVFSSLILYINFPENFETPGKRLAEPDPATYLKVALELFCAMVVTGGVVTIKYSGIDFATTELMHWYGYNNVCVVFDDPPASYICPVYWVGIAYFAAKYCVADTARVYASPSVSGRMRAAVYGVNTAFAFVACFFAVCLGVGPKENMYLHTTPFMTLVLVLPCVHWLRVAQWRQPAWFVALVVCFTLASAAKLVFTGYALSHPGNPLPLRPARAADTLWVLLALSSSFLMLPSPRAGLSEEANKTVTQATVLQYLTLPLALVYVVYVPVAIACHLVVGLVKRALAACGAIGGAPDARAPSGGARASKLPVHSPFIGDIFGYVGLLRGGWKPLHEGARALGAGAMAAGLGQPCVVLTGADACESARALRDNTLPTMGRWQRWLFAETEPCGGAADPKRLAFHRQLCSKDAAGAEFGAAVGAARAELASWARMHASKRLAGKDTTELAQRASVAFASAFLLGGVVDVELVASLFPSPAALPLYPWLPLARACLPAAARARVVREELFAQMQAMPRWPAVRELAARAGLAERAALGDVLGVVLFNARALVNPWANALALLKVLPAATVAELGASGARREALAWELLRFAGPRSAFVASADATLVDGARAYSVKAGTRLLSLLGLAQMDPALYAQPWAFKPERFLPRPPLDLARPAHGREPLPTMALGLRFGGLADDAAASASCVCPFARLAQPAVLAMVELLLFEFDYALDDADDADRVADDQSSLLLASGDVDMSPARLQTTAGAADFALAAKSGGGFALLHFATRGGAAPLSPAPKTAAARARVCASKAAMF